MTKDKIKKIAISNFARYGFKGASLEKIAQEVGIKKPSIYSHFKNKEDLYINCLEEVILMDYFFVDKYLHETKEQSLEIKLKHFLISYKKRAEENDEVMFWIRSLYFPPRELEEKSIERTNEYIFKIKKLFEDIFEEEILKDKLHKYNAEELAEAYLCIFDGCMLELFYTGDSGFNLRLNSIWKVFWRGIAN